MPLTPTRRAAVAIALCAASATGVQAVALPAARAAAPADRSAAAQQAAPSPSAVHRIETPIARTFAASLADPAWRAEIRRAVLGNGELDLSSLTGSRHAPAGFGAAVATADRGIAAAKGLSAGGPLLRLRLGDKSMRAALDSGAAPLVAVAENGKAASTVAAYDSSGRVHSLSTRQAPKQPVYVVDIDVSKALASGLAQVDKQLAKSGLDTAATPNGSAAAAPRARTGVNSRAATGGFWTTKMDAVYLNDDEETWIEGDAEIFSVVSGFGFDGKVRVDTVDMPYLDNDHTTYYPNQIIVNWSNYKYNLADLVMMEDDGSTNYSALAKALADALLTITDQGTYVPLVDAILAAMPDSWWTNDPDYVDSWYTLAQTSSGRLNGARGNGWMNVSPYWVSEL